MTIDLTAAADFMAGHARHLDRRRFELVTGQADNLAARWQPWGLSQLRRRLRVGPGARSSLSREPAGCLPSRVGSLRGDRPHDRSAGRRTLRLSRLRNPPRWGLADGLAAQLTAGSGPWWKAADPSVSSLQITSVVAAAAQRVAVHDPAVAAHPRRARDSLLLDAIEAIDETPEAYLLGRGSCGGGTAR